MPLHSPKRLMSPEPRPHARSGFTLVELIIVIIILGILATLAIPQFTSSTEDAKAATLAANQAVIQKAVQRYQLEHGQQLPDARIVAQLTQYTKGNGEPRAQRGPPYNFGPYLTKFPDNPFATGATDPDGVTVAAQAAPLSADASPANGWKYSSVTGEVIPNTHTSVPGGGEGEEEEDDDDD